MNERQAASAIYSPCECVCGSPDLGTADGSLTATAVPLTLYIDLYSISDKPRGSPGPSPSYTLFYPRFSFRLFLSLSSLSSFFPFFPVCLLPSFFLSFSIIPSIIVRSPPVFLSAGFSLFLFLSHTATHTRKPPRRRARVTDAKQREIYRLSFDFVATVYVYTYVLREGARA